MKIRYNRKTEKAIEKEWKRYPEYPPVRYAEDEKKNDYKELCRDIFAFTYGNGFVTEEFLQKVLNAIYTSKIIEGYYDPVEVKDYRWAFLWKKKFRYKWEGFTIEIVAEYGHVNRNFLDVMFGRDVNVADYWANIYCDGIPVETISEGGTVYNKYMAILTKFFESIKQKVREAQFGIEEKVKKVVEE